MEAVNQTQSEKTPKGSFPPVVKWCVSILLGLLCGVFFHYMIYRLSLPSHPFIYANF